MKATLLLNLDFNNLGKKKTGKLKILSKKAETTRYFEQFKLFSSKFLI